MRILSYGVRLDPLAIALDQLRLAFDRGVHGVVPQVQVEGALGLGLFLHHLKGLVGQAIRQVVPFPTWFQVGNVAPVAKVGIAVVRIPKGLRGSPQRAAHVEMEAVGLRVGLRPPDVPLAEVGVEVARLLEDLGQGEMLHRQRIHANWLEQLAVSPVEGALPPNGHVEAGRMLAREDRHPRRRANRAGRIGVGEAHALLGQFVQMRCLVQIVAVAGQSRPPEIVDQDQDDVWLLRRMGEGCHEAGGKDDSGNEIHVADRTKIILQQTQGGQCQ